MLQRRTLLESLRSDDNKIKSSCDPVALGKRIASDGSARHGPDIRQLSKIEHKVRAARSTLPQFMDTKITLTAAINKFFGRKPEQTMGQFADEIKKLTQKDKEEFRVELERELGCVIEN